MELLKPALDLQSSRTVAWHALQTVPYSFWCGNVLQDVERYCVSFTRHAHSHECHCRCRWVWLWSSLVARLPTARRCQAGMPRQLRLALHMAMGSPMLAQPRRPLSLPGMGPMTLRLMSDLWCQSYRVM